MVAMAVKWAGCAFEGGVTVNENSCSSPAASWKGADAGSIFHPWEACKRSVPDFAPASERSITATFLGA